MARKQTNAPALQTAAQAPATAQAAPSPLAAMAVTLAAAAQPAPATSAQVVPVRGGLAIAKVKLTGKPYRVSAPHNLAWWETLGKLVQATEGGVVPVADCVKAGLPVTHVGYLVRRGYLAEAK